MTTSEKQSRSGSTIASSPLLGATGRIPRKVAVCPGPCPYPGWKGTFIRIHFQPEHKGAAP